MWGSHLELSALGAGERVFSWHNFHFLIFLNFLTKDTENTMIQVARVILRLGKKV